MFRQSSNEVSATVPEPGSTGGAVEGVPASLQPRPSPRVDAARARVATDPGTIDHWSELGSALIEAQGWIDAYTVSEEMLARFPGHPDGHVIQAVVRIAMGMEQEAVRLLELARAAAPNHVPALSYSGMLAVRRGDTDAARIFWAQAMQASPLEQRAEFAELLAMLDRPGGFGAPAGAEGGPAHPSVSIV